MCGGADGGRFDRGPPPYLGRLQPRPAASTAAARLPAKPNILLILTDDQDQMLGAGFEPADADSSVPTPMRKTRRLIGEAGVTARNFFAHSPICCPSRAELLTGR